MIESPILNRRFNVSFRDFVSFLEDALGSDVDICNEPEVEKFVIVKEQEMITWLRQALSDYRQEIHQ